jgi:hypothetical protein
MSAFFSAVDDFQPIPVAILALAILLCVGFVFTVTLSRERRRHVQEFRRRRSSSVTQPIRPVHPPTVQWPHAETRDGWARGAEERRVS